MKPSPGEERPSPHETKNNNKDLEEEKGDDPYFDVPAFVDRCDLIVTLLRESGIFPKNKDATIVPLMKQLIANAAKTYLDSSWYKPAFELMVKNNAKSFTYVEAVWEDWQRKGGMPKVGAARKEKEEQKSEYETIGL